MSSTNSSPTRNGPATPHEQVPPATKGNTTAVSPSPTTLPNGEHASTEVGSDRIYHDHVSVLVYCTTDNTYFLTQPSGTLTLLGIHAVAFGDSWKKTIETFFQNAGLTNLKPEGIIHLDRWWVPGVDKLTSHAIFSVSVEYDLKETISEKFPGTWLSIDEVENARKSWRFFSPSISDIIINLNTGSKTGGYELTYEDLFSTLRAQSSSTTKKNGFEQLVLAAKFGKEEQELLYNEFMTHSCPFTCMGWVPFASFMIKLGWQQNVLYDLFRTFDVQGKGGLLFREFLYGLAAVEPTVQHGGAPAEIRCRYIFRYYDRNADSKLSPDELTTMAMDVNKAKSVSMDMAFVQQETERIFKIYGESTTRSIPLTNFLTAVGQLKFRGTSYLLRAPTSMLVYLKPRRTTMTNKNHLQYDQAEIPKSRQSQVDVESMTSSRTEDISVEGLKMPDSSTSRYDLAAHSVRLRKSGTVLDVHSVHNTQNNQWLNQSQNPQLQQQQVVQQIGTESNNTKRILSYDRFNPETQPNEMLNGLRYFERNIQPLNNKMKPKPSFDWGEVNRSALATCLISLCRQVRDIMQNEPRLLEIPTPCYIMGDLHGNFPDLLCFERALWKLGPMLTPASFLFLGDFVDRGAFGVEVVAYLFTHKVLSPSKFYLIRGNHEIREVQQMFTFYRECIVKFGDRVGREVWDEVNAAFDCMPLAAVVDRKVFCAHGGICPPWYGDGYVAIINTIPCPLPKPEDMSPLAWELMWNDPERAEDAAAANTSAQVPSAGQEFGFRLNTRRGTGHVFSEDALDNFLNKNGFSHVVRAHEVQ